MPDVIQLLPDNVANQIAAGEVVQRPASVVKELLENAIDAKASHIQLIIKDAGRTLIQLVDDGTGMSSTDARMAFERHATSKIRTTEDIFHINTKGFRGEALASIAAVSQVELKTQKEEDEVGTQINIDGGEIISQNPVNFGKGSSFMVKNLFFNVPARRKFLKSNSVEFRHILDEFHRVALAHENISFQLFHNEEEIFRLRKGNLLQRISEIFGRKMQANLIPISEEIDWIKVSGYVGKPEIAKKTRGEQFFFVNHRYFRSNYFNKAIQNAFENLIDSQYFPTFFLYLEINPEMIDVNIHPTKTEVKFEDEASIFALLRSSIKKSLGVYNITPSLDFSLNPEWSFLPAQTKSEVKVPEIKVNPNFNPFERYSNQPKTQEKVNLQQLYETARKAEVTPEMFEIPSAINENSFLRLSDGRWITEYNGDILMIDPYRIHQTLIYDRQKKNFKGNSLSQQLLFSIERPMYGTDSVKLSSIQKEMFSLGFDWILAEDLLSITAIPSEIQQEKVLDLLDTLLEQLTDHSEEEFSEFFSKSVSKITAKKRNEFMLSSQVSVIFSEFEKLTLPRYNPFGKKNYIKLETQKFD